MDENTFCIVIFCFFAFLLYRSDCMNCARLLRDQLVRKIQFGLQQVSILIKPNLVEGPAPRKAPHRSAIYKTPFKTC